MLFVIGAKTRQIELSHSAPHYFVEDMTQRREYAKEVVAPLPAAQDRLSVPVLGAGIGGNLLEWYDFGIYGLLAPVLARVFFPAENRIAARIGGYGLVASGSCMGATGRGR